MSDPRSGPSNPAARDTRGWFAKIRAMPGAIAAIAARAESNDGRLDHVELQLDEMLRLIPLVDHVQQRMDHLELRQQYFEEKINRRLDDMWTIVTGIEPAILAKLSERFDAIRSEAQHNRALIEGRIEAEGEATELIGRLLQGAEARLALLEDALAPSSTEHSLEQARQRTARG